VGAWGAGVILGMALLLGLIVVFHFSPAATLAAMAATARAAHAERSRIEALVRRAGPKLETGKEVKPARAAPTAAPPPEPIKVIEEPSFLEQLDQELPEEPPASPRAGPSAPVPPAPVMRVVADPVGDEPEIDGRLPGINVLEAATARKERVQDEMKHNVKVIE